MASESRESERLIFCCLVRHFGSTVLVWDLPRKTLPVLLLLLLCLGLLGRVLYFVGEYETFLLISGVYSLVPRVLGVNLVVLGEYDGTYSAVFMVYPLVNGVDLLVLQLYPVVTGEYSDVLLVYSVVVGIYSLVRMVYRLGLEEIDVYSVVLGVRPKVLGMNSVLLVYF